MKKLWLIVIGLSIISQSYSDEQVLEGVGVQGIEPGCFKFVKPSKGGYELLEVTNETPKCGWLTVEKLSNAYAGSDTGWSGYVKLVKNDNPDKAFYLGTIAHDNTISLNFGGTQQVACYVCDGNATCDPNAPDAKKNCFDRALSGYMHCEKQVDCSKVINVTTCYKTGKGQMAVVSNALDLCKNYEGGKLENYGVGPGSYAQQQVASSVVGK